MDTSQNVAPAFERVSQYETMLAHAYPAATADAIKRLEAIESLDDLV